MADVIYRRNDCRGCSSRDLELVFALKPTPIGDAYVTADKLNVSQPSYPIDLYMCGNCGLAQLIDVVDPEILYGDYIYVTSSSLGLADHFREYAGSVVERCGLKSGARVVDIGSNDGTLLRHFLDRGMEVLGVEPASHIAAQATASGVTTISAFFSPELATRMVTEHGHAKVITANNVVANIDDLRSLVIAIDRLLDRDGVFVFESYYLADVLQNMVFDFIYHEHLTSFSVRPVQALFATVGLELVAAQRVSTKGGSLRYFIQRPGGPLSSDGSVEALREFENQIGLYVPETYRSFADKIDGLRDQTKAFLAAAKLAGKSVAGFGASITGTTLLYHFDIGGDIDYLVDDNPAKQGRFSPGLHLPVLPSSVLLERKPDYVVVLAWRYASPFIEKNHSYLANGGVFVVPVPEFKLIANG